MGPPRPDDRDRGYYNHRNRDSADSYRGRGYPSARHDSSRDYNDRDRRPRSHSTNHRDERSSSGKNDSYYGHGRGDEDRRSYSNGRQSYHERGDRRRDDEYYGRGGRDRGQYDRRRDEDRGRHGNDPGARHEGKDWKCVECLVWNYPDDYRCSRCGLRRPDGDRSGSSSPSSGSMDEFGRRSIEKKKVEKEWPPVFQDNTDEFTLDARSGMFYQKESDFFYDPTSKYYYSNKKRAYFSYNSETKKFDPVEGSSGPAPPAGSNGAAEPTDEDHLLLVPNGAKSNSTADPPKKMISINLKTAIPAKSDKKRKKRSEDKDKQDSTPTAAAASQGPASKLQKQHAANMDKWEERDKERKQDEEGSGKISYTKDGKPICWLCERKFPNVEMLELHKEKSKLHLENLAKKEQEEENAKQKEAEDAAKYVDRAQQRRDMYGPELVLPPPDAKADISPPTVGDAAVNHDRPMENPTNKGHEMLQKLGWKSGDGLGRGGEEQQKQQAALAQDWERIEGLAAQNGAGRSRGR